VSRNNVLQIFHALLLEFLLKSVSMMTWICHVAYFFGSSLVLLVGRQLAKILLKQFTFGDHM